MHTYIHTYTFLFSLTLKIRFEDQFPFTTIQKYAAPNMHTRCLVKNTKHKTQKKNKDRGSVTTVSADILPDFRRAKSAETVVTGPRTTPKAISHSHTHTHTLSLALRCSREARGISRLILPFCFCPIFSIRSDSMHLTRTSYSPTRTGNCPKEKGNKGKQQREIDRTKKGQYSGPASVYVYLRPLKLHGNYAHPPKGKDVDTMIGKKEQMNGSMIRVAGKRRRCRVIMRSSQESECSLRFLPIGSVPSARSDIGIACMPPGSSPVSSFSMCIHLPMTR